MTSTEPENYPNAERWLIQFRVQTALRVAHADKLIPHEYHASYLDDCKFVDQIFSKFREIRKQSIKKDTLFKMVQLVEVEDEHFQGAQQAQAEDEGDFTDTDSEISADSDFDPSQESFSERLAALKDIVPPTTRGWIGAQVNTGSRAVQATWYYGSRTLWVVCATALMIGVPLATCWAEDQQIEGMEREYRMREQGGELLTAGDEAAQQGGSTADKLNQSLGKAEARPSL